MSLALTCLLAFTAGYLVRRWQRPVGYGMSDGISEGEWRLMVAGGMPYRSVTARGKFPMEPVGMATLLASMETLTTSRAPLHEPL